VSAAIAVLHAPGTNRDGEAARAIGRAGGSAEIVMADADLGPFAGVVVPGGFSHGDALGAGNRMALDCGASLAAFAATGRPVLGICNGFQVLVRAGLLPGCGGGDVTLTHNAGGAFVCRWVTLAFGASQAALGPLTVACPVAHGEGRLAVSGPDVVSRLEAGGQVLCRYVEGTNPNGSVGDIAGLCNPAGNVWGLMPHPEDHVQAAQNPFGGRPGREGLPLFEAFVARARAH
jgi:phosphoribosylformylglycinamidine synthase I